MKYVLQNGLMSAAEYPYSGRQGTCKLQSSRIAARFRRYTVVPYANEAQLALVVERYGPASVAIDAGTLSFQFYQSGIFRDPMCSSTRLNHGVLVVGYGPDYW
jgi:cathepsin L